MRHLKSFWAFLCTVTDGHLTVEGTKVHPSLALRVEVGYEFSAAFMIPKWYGVAYRMDDRAATVLWVMPLNILARWWRVARLYLKNSYSRSAVEEMMYQAYRNGYGTGKDDAKQRWVHERAEVWVEGRNAGIKWMHDSMLRQVNGDGKP